MTSDSVLSSERLAEMHNVACDRMVRDFDAPFAEFTAQEAYNLVTELLSRRSLDDGGPVAWQVMLPGGHEGAIHRVEEEADAVAAGFKTAFVRPLFAALTVSQEKE